MNDMIINFYETILLRTPSEDEVSYWSNVLDETSPEEVRAAILHSEEGAHVQTVVLPVIALYQGLLGRTPEPEGLEFWTDGIETGDLTIQNLLDAFAGSPEFQELHPELGPDVSSQELATLFYENLLGREPDEGGLAFWSSLLESGDLSLGDFSALFIGADETQAAIGEALRAYYDDVQDGVIDDPANEGSLLEPGDPDDPGDPGDPGDPDPDVVEVSNEGELVAALAEAGDGEIISLTENIELTATLNVDRSIIIDGNGHEISTASGAGYGILITADNVSISNVGVDAEGTNNFGIKVQPISPDQELTGLTLESVTVADAGRTGIDLNGVHESSLTDVTATGNGGNGITLTDSTDITLTDVTTTDNAWGGVGIYARGTDFAEGGVSNITFVGYSSEGEPVGIYAEEYGEHEVSGVSINEWSTAYVVTQDNPDHDNREFSFFFESLTEAIEYADEIGTESHPATVSVQDDSPFEAGAGTEIDIHQITEDGTTVHGGPGYDYIIGSDGNDIIAAGNAGDSNDPADEGIPVTSPEFGEFNNILIGGNGSDLLAGGWGDNAGTTIMFGGDVSELTNGVFAESEEDVDLAGTVTSQWHPSSGEAANRYQSRDGNDIIVASNLTDSVEFFVSAGGETPFDSFEQFAEARLTIHQFNVEEDFIWFAQVGATTNNQPEITSASIVWDDEGTYSAGTLTVAVSRGEEVANISIDLVGVQNANGDTNANDFVNAGLGWHVV